MTINVATQFSVTPGGRYISEGEFSGELFRQELLKPAFLQCKEKGDKLIVDLDGGYGYGTSFLDEAFGGLARELKDNSILDIHIISEEEPELIERIKEYIQKGLKG